MKIDYKLEIDKDEINAFFNGINKVVTNAVKNAVSSLNSKNKRSIFSSSEYIEGFNDRIESGVNSLSNGGTNGLGADPEIKSKSYSSVENKIKNEKEERQKRQDTLFGRTMFVELVRIWCKNFDIENAPQPDRFSHISRAFNQHSKEIFLYIRGVGGLTNAVRDAYGEIVNFEQGIINIENEGRRIAFNTNTRLIAENMCQVASQLIPELYQMLEYDKSIRNEKIGSKYYQIFKISDNTVADNNPNNVAANSEVLNDQDYVNPSYLNPSWSEQK